MTLAMPDSVTLGNIPMGFDAVLGYVDGIYQTAPRIPALFPGHHVVTLTVLGGDLAADGVDCEPGNVNAQQAAAWVQRKIQLDPSARPVVYASMEGNPGYGMPWVIAELLKLGIHRTQWRCLTAHYTHEPHICSPETCQVNGQPIGFQADGTQWTDQYPGTGGSRIDMSLLSDDFFGPPVPTQPDRLQEILMQLILVKQGMTGQPVRTVQGLCCARGHVVAIDGVFGPATDAAVRQVQAHAGVSVDGVVGPVTWRALLGV